MPSPHKKSFAAEQLRRQKRVNPVVWVLVGVVLVAIVVGGYVLYQRSLSQKQVETEPRQIKSIAVLSFRNLSADEDQEYFCDGIAEVIINALTHVKGLRVIASTSSFTFKGKDAKVREIGKELDVDAILEGSVQKAGNRLRITAQLIKVADESHLFSETYDRNLEDIFAIQDTISLAIVEALKVELLGKEKTAIEKRQTENTEAYNLYLLGRYHWHKRTEEGINKGLEYFRQAVEQDPEYALAYVGIADSYNMLGVWGNMLPSDVFPKAKIAAEKALEIDNMLAEAHASLALISTLFDWDWDAAESGFTGAIGLNPNYTWAHDWFADYLVITGKFSQALPEYIKAIELNPLSLVIYDDIAKYYIMIKEYDAAMEQCQKANEIDPNFVPIYNSIGKINVLKGKYKEAIKNYQKAREITGATNSSSALGYIYAVTGEKDKAERILHELIERKKKLYVRSSDIASIYCGLGNIDKTFEWLEKANEEREPFLQIIKTLPDWEPIRSDPRFKALLKRMGLPED